MGGGPVKGEVVVFRGTRDGLQVMLDDEVAFDAVQSELLGRLQSAEYFFRGGDITLDTGRRILTEEQVLALHEIARQHRMRITRIVSHPDTPRTGQPARPHSGSEEDALIETRLHRRTLRSGQLIEHDGSVVVLGDVNPGAEVRAGGDVLVLGTVRGVVHAGAAGNHDAVVVAFRLMPTQIRIGACIGRPPEGSGQAPLFPEIARVKGGAIIVEQLNPS